MTSAGGKLLSRAARDSRPTERDLVAHLLRRAGFGPTPQEIDAATARGLEATVNQLVDYEATPDNFAPPDPSLIPPKSGAVSGLAEWWLGRMLQTSRPLQEKMTLFWHGHFATANYKVFNPGLMYQQSQTFRLNALPVFDDMVKAMYKDPAMLIWLDGRVNTKYAPNENWGREVLELFSLGPGNYTEDDVHANARSFTGWILNQKDQPFFIARLHDETVKTLLGQTGNWGPDDAVRIIAAHPAAGPFLATKLWHFFGSDDPSDAVIQHLASTYYSSGHSIREMVRQMLLMPEFYPPSVGSSHVKSPVEFVTNSLRPLGLAGVDVTGYARVLAILGQELFNPPNVGGWPGSVSWINGGTMLARFNLASRITGDAPGGQAQVDVATLLQEANPASARGFLVYLADRLGITLTSDTGAALLAYAGVTPVERWPAHPYPSEDPAYNVPLETKVSGLIHLLLASPEFQIA